MGETLENLLKIAVVRFVVPWLNRHLSSERQAALWGIGWPLILWALFLWLLVEFIKVWRDGQIPNWIRGVRKNGVVQIVRSEKSFFMAIAPILVSIVLLLLAAIGSWPYDFYVLLRVVIFVVCLIQFFGEASLKTSSGWFFVILGVGILYNPLLPIHLHRDTWAALNWATLAVLAVYTGRFMTSRTR